MCGELLVDSRMAEDRLQRWIAEAQVTEAERAAREQRFRALFAPPSRAAGQ